MSSIQGAAASGPTPSTAPQAQYAPSAATSSAERLADRIRLSLLAGWVALLVALLATGSAPGTWQDLRDQVAAGKVDGVRVIGELGPGSTGYSVVEVQWRDGLLQRRTEVVQLRGPNQLPDDAAADASAPVLRSAPSRRLTALNDELQVTRDQSRQSHGELWGWRVPTAVGLFGLVLWLLVLGRLIAGPRPWRATRWAWFWLLMVPIGAPAFLLLSGPTPGLPAPRRPGRRLTGGWAFLLAGLVAAVTTTP